MLLIALTTCATITLAVIALLQRPPNPVRERARALGRETDGAARPGDLPFSTRVMQPMTRGLIHALLALLPGHWLRKLDRKLIAAGEPVDLGLFILLWLLVGLGSAAGGALWLGPSGLVVFGIAGFAAPYLWLRRRVQRRQRRIINALPDAIDLLVTCVESGLGLDAALIRLGEVTEGPLGDELSATLRQIAMGRPRQEALAELGERSGVTDLDRVIRPIVQAERGGVSIGAALRVQAEGLRLRRRQRAQELAQKLPVKMTLPITLFFLPAMLIIGIGPAIFSFIDLLEEM
jgi:tight adherence protein C